MSKIHEELPNQSFSGPPEGIVTATICSRSGKLPIPGLCDGTLRTEYFAEGTVPTETCDVHYAGQVCTYSNLPACEGCPFKTEGVLELTPVEDVSLQSGTAAALGLPQPTEQTVQQAETTEPVEGADAAVTPTPQINMCPHNAEFFANPNWEAVVNGQRAEMQQRAAAAAAAAAQAAAEAQQAAEQPVQPQ